ncbi:MAG TPA: hypothetical protein PLW78_03615 [bacterium]|nr:hypothetical protein [bacterium]
MGFWKVLTGVAIGVGAVAAAPFTGGGSLLAGASLGASLAGAGTVAAAVGAGLAGGVAGGIMSDVEEDEKKRIKANAREEGYRAAEITLQQKFAQNLEVFQKKNKEIESYYDMVLALTSVGIAIAQCDGDYCEQEKEDIREYVAGISFSVLPTWVKEAIAKMEVSKVSFKDAMKYVKKMQKQHWKLVDNVIDMITHSDGIVHDSEIAFKKAWKDFKKAA